MAALAVWLTGITLYFLFSKKDDIRWIPLSLCVASFLLAVGPWSIFSYSRQNQAERFGALLEKYKLLNDSGKLTGKGTLPAEDYDRLLSGVRYFRDRKEIRTLDSYFATLPQTNRQEDLANAMINQLNQAASKAEDSQASNTVLNYALQGGNLGMEVDIKGFDLLWDFDFYGDKTFERGAWKIASSNNGALLSVFQDGRKLVTWDVATRLTEMEARYGSSTNDLPATSLTFEHPRMRLVLKKASRIYPTYAYQGVLLRKE